MEELDALIRRTLAGDLEAFGVLVTRFQDMAYGCAYAVLGDFHLAEDAAQEAFLLAYRDLAKLAEPLAFPGWLRRIVLRCCNRLTRRKVLPLVPLETAAAVAGAETPPPAAAEENEMRDRVADAIRRLPEGERMATTLFYINGYSQKEIAAFLEVPATTVNNRLHAARKRLKERMLKMVDQTLKSYPLPGNFAGVVVRKVASPDDLRGAATLLSYRARKHPEHFRSPAEAERAGIYVVGDEGRMQSAGVYGEHEIGIGSTILRAVRPAEMGAEAQGVPHPAFVKGFQACFKLAAERSIHLGLVHGSMFDHAFCGFVPCFYYPVATLPCEKAKSVASRARIVKANGEQQKAAAQAWLLDPYAPKISAYIGGGVTHVVKQDGKVAGYVRVNRDFRPADCYGMPFGHVTDVTVATREAAQAVIRLAGELASRAGDEQVVLMQSHMTRLTQTVLALGGTYVLRGACDVVGLDAEMAVIIDLPGLTQELADEFQSRLAASAARHVDAAFSLEMNGQTVGFVVKAGRLKIASTEQRRHCPLAHWLVTRLYLGYYSGEDVLAVTPVPYTKRRGQDQGDLRLHATTLNLPEPEQALFRALFPKLWPCAWPDPDVWPWVIGEEHPRYQGADHKTEKMKAEIDALRFSWIGY